MRGGLSNDPLIAADQIARISEVRPNNVLRTERVILVRDSGPEKLRVEMEFGDGIKRNVTVKSGETYVLATLRTSGEKTIQELYRSHCGNKTGMVISSGRINTLNRDENGNIILPSGWRFVKEAEYIRPATEEIVTEITESSAATPIPAPAVTPAPISELETIITAIGKVMPKGGKKFNLEYEIGGKKSKIKLEME
ncbi:MAG: hypothetical protein PHE20_01755 [Patescibacteria group bacterium]|nr:hypothetical protein [Patescibacteria group bacterium]